MNANETTVVVPPKMAARVAASGDCSHTSSPRVQPLYIGSAMWACASTPPGSTSRPVASMIRAASIPAKPGSATTAIWPCWMPMSSRRVCVGVTTNPPRRIRSSISSASGAGLEAWQHPARPGGDALLVLGQACVDGSIKIGRAGLGRCPHLGLHLIRRASEDKAALKILTHPQPLGQGGVGVFLLVGHRAVGELVIGRPKVAQRGVIFRRHQLAFQPGARKVRGERGRGPGALLLSGARYRVD